MAKFRFGTLVLSHFKNFGSGRNGENYLAPSAIEGLQCGMCAETGNRWLELHRRPAKRAAGLWGVSVHALADSARMVNER
jgi:hypothetical protein